MSVAIYSVATIGEVEKGERFTFVSKSKYNPGDHIDLKRQVPANGPAYGYAVITSYLGPSKNGLREYAAYRTR
jgi:hypothetical protein